MRKCQELLKGIKDQRCRWELWRPYIRSINPLLQDRSISSYEGKQEGRGRIRQERPIIRCWFIDLFSGLLRTLLGSLIFKHNFMCSLEWTVGGEGTVVLSNLLTVTYPSVESCSLAHSRLLGLGQKMRMQTGPGRRPFRNGPGLGPPATSPVVHTHWRSDSLTITTSFITTFQREQSRSWDLCLGPRRLKRVWLAFTLVSAVQALEASLTSLK